jgi:hypothetical protein
MDALCTRKWAIGPDGTGMCKAVERHPFGPQTVLKRWLLGASAVGCYHANGLTDNRRKSRTHNGTGVKGEQTKSVTSFVKVAMQTGNRPAIWSNQQQVLSVCNVDRHLSTLWVWTVTSACRCLMCSLLQECNRLCWTALRPVGLLKLRGLESQENVKGTNALGLVHTVIVNSSGCSPFPRHTMVNVSGLFLCLLLMHALKLLSAHFWLQECDRLFAKPCESPVACCQSAYCAFLPSASHLFLCHQWLIHAIKVLIVCSWLWEGGRVHQTVWTSLLPTGFLKLRMGNRHKCLRLASCSCAWC